MLLIKTLWLVVRFAEPLVMLTRGALCILFEPWINANLMKLMHTLQSPNLVPVPELFQTYDAYSLVVHASSLRFLLAFFLSFIQFSILTFILIHFHTCQVKNILILFLLSSLNTELHSMIVGKLIIIIPQIKMWAATNVTKVIFIGILVKQITLSIMQLSMILEIVKSDHGPADFTSGCFQTEQIMNSLLRK